MAEGTENMEATMATGAREAKHSWFARMVARAMSRELRAFVVPGEDVARARGLDIEGAGLRVSVTPRHASVLVLVGETPPGLKRAAAIAYAQMPRPRAILAVGAGDLSPLPDPDVRTASEQVDLARGVEELGLLYSENAFRGEASDFDVAFLAGWGPVADAAPGAFEQTRLLGLEIMERSMLIFETAGMTILTAMIAATATAVAAREVKKRGEGGMIALFVALAIGAILFGIGLYGALSQTNLVMIMMGVEVMLGGAIVNLVAFWRFLHPEVFSGQMFVLIVMTVMALEMAVGFGVGTSRFRGIGSVEMEEARDLKG